MSEKKQDEQKGFFTEGIKKNEKSPYLAGL